MKVGQEYNPRLCGTLANRSQKTVLGTSLTEVTQVGGHGVGGEFMGNTKFSFREMKFLEFYFGGALMKTAARAAGYRGASDQALCNTGRKILEKISKTPQALFRFPGPRERRIAQLLGQMAFNSKSELKQLKALEILGRCYYS